MTHTGEPWHYSPMLRPPVGHGQHDTDANGNILWGYSISGSNEHGGHILPTLGCTHNFPGQTEANAKRIVACVNALAGIPNEQIERDAKLYAHVRELLNIALRLTRSSKIPVGIGQEARDALAKLEESQ